MNITITKTTHPGTLPPSDQLGFGTVFTDHMFLMDYSADKGWHDARVVPYGPITMSPAASPSSPCSRRPPTASPARPAPASTSKSGSDKSPNVPYNLYKRFARKGKPFVCFFSPFSAFSPLSLKIFQQLWLCFQFFFSFARCVLLENFV